MTKRASIDQGEVRDYLESLSIPDLMERIAENVTNWNDLNKMAGRAAEIAGRAAEGFTPPGPSEADFNAAIAAISSWLAIAREILASKEAVKEAQS